jgi:signal transduction histidine kinase
VTVRVRLALFFTILVGLTLALMGTATYKLLRVGLLTEIERDVSRRASAFAASHATPYYLDVFSAPDVFLQVVNEAGTPVASSGNLGERLLPFTPGMRSGHVAEARVGGRPLYLTAAPLGEGRFIIVARSPVTIYSALRQLRRLLYVVVGTALLVTASLGWLFASAAVRPIEQANQRLRQFLAEAAHELRAPLTLILSNLDLLTKVGEDDPAFRVQALGDIRTEANRMARLITHLLILGRADAGAKTAAEPLRLAGVVAEACRQAQGMAAGVRLTTRVDRALDDVIVKGDADYLNQLFLILLDNAFKYTTAGGEVRVEASLEDGRARVIVADTGSGIDPLDIPRIFDRFYRGGNAAGTPGTGLGLAIARWVAEQHGGRIEVESTPGGGSRFSVVLPAFIPSS